MGSYIDPVTFLIEIAIIVILSVAASLLAPKPKITDQRPATLGQFQFPTATEGRSVPLIWGTVKIIAPNVLWYGDLKTVPITKKIKTGIFSSKEQVLGYQYFLGIQFALCRGTVDKLTRIWVDDKLVFTGDVSHREFALINKPFLYGGEDQQGGVKGHMRLLAGDNDQGIDGYLDAALNHASILTTPAYRGTSYLMWSNRVATSAGHELKTLELNAAGTGYSVADVITLAGGTSSPAPTVRVLSVGGSGEVLSFLLLTQGVFSSISGASNLTQASVSPAGGTGATFHNATYEPLDVSESRGPGYIGNTTQVKPFAFEVQRIPNGLGLTMGHEIVQTYEANPAAVLYEILTDVDWGLGFSSGDIDLTVFRAAGDTLYTEDNGFSLILDAPRTASDLIAEIERQIEGIVFVDRTTGKWTLKLVRADYTLSMQPAVDETNVLEVKDFARSSWKNTKNNVQVPFVDRSKNYKSTYAIAQDVANMALQGGLIATTSDTYPGVMSRTNANHIAWRGLKNAAYPLAKVSLVLDRTMYFLNPGDVVRWSNAILGITDMALRVIRVDLGSLEDGQITIDAIQDVFAFEEASFADPEDSDWVDPGDTVPVDIISADRCFFEAPKAFTDRDLGGGGTLGNGGGLGGGGVYNRIWTGARYQNDSTTAFDIYTNDEGIGYFLDGKTYGFLVAGKLDADLETANTPGADTITIDCDPDTQEDILNVIQSRSPDEIGQHLKNIVLIDNEFIGFQTAAANGTTKIDLGGCYRSLMDTVPAHHDADARVWFISTIGNLTERHFIFTHDVDVKPLPLGPFGQLAIGDATATTITINRRGKLPYPPCQITLNTVVWEDNVHIGSGVDVEFVRRDFRTINEVDAVIDETSLLSDFPTFNTTEYLIKVYVDPEGANTLTFTSAWQSGNTIHLDHDDFSGTTTLIATTFDAADDSNLPAAYDTYTDSSLDAFAPGTSSSTKIKQTSAQGIAQANPTVAGLEYMAAKVNTIMSMPTQRSITVRARFVGDEFGSTVQIWDRYGPSSNTGILASFDMEDDGMNIIIYCELDKTTVGTGAPGTGFSGIADNSGSPYIVAASAGFNTSTPHEFDITLTVNGDDYELLVEGVSQLTATESDLNTQDGIGFGFGFLANSLALPAVTGVVSFLATTGGAASRARITIDTRHVFGVTTVSALQTFSYDFDVTDP